MSLFTYDTLLGRVTRDSDLDVPARPVLLHSNVHMLHFDLLFRQRSRLHRTTTERHVAKMATPTQMKKVKVAVAVLASSADWPKMEASVRLRLLSGDSVISKWIIRRV